MDEKILELDLGERSTEARQFKRDNPNLTLAKFLQTYPARFPGGKIPSAEYMKLPVASFIFQLVQVKDTEMPVSTPQKTIRTKLDDIWQEEQKKEEGCSQRKDEPAEYPENITDNEAVRIAYRHEMDTIADFLRNGLSVLVGCDKMLTEYIYEFVCHQAGKKVVLETDQPENNRQGMGGRLDQALQGNQANVSGSLASVIHNLKSNEILVLRSLDMLDMPPMIELLYQRTGKGEKPQFLAFLDPSLSVKKVLTDRFAIHVALMGLPRYVSPDEQHAVYAVTLLLTKKERACFCDYDPEGLYKNVSGLNAIQFRNAMQYVGARVAKNTESSEIYRVIRRFKISSSDEIEIPDITFEDIGGYEQVKQQLKRIIALIAGAVQGLNEKQRGQLIPRGFVFHGPPGTGKTLFAKAIANEMNATIQMVSGPEIMDKYVGESENKLRRLFAIARRNAPAIIFFDEFDSIASQRSTYADGGARANNAVVAQFLTELDGFRQDQTVLVIGTTNRIDIIDEALLRPSRLCPIEIGLPDYAARKRVAEIHAKSFGVDLLLKDLCVLATEHLNAWQIAQKSDSDRKIPQSFLEMLFTQHPPYQKRYEMEAQRTGFLRELQEFFVFVEKSRSESIDQAQTTLLEQLDNHIIKIGKRYGVDLSRKDLPDLKTQETESLLIPMQTDIRDLFAVLQQEQKKHGGLTPETFWEAILDLVAEYTEQFNNDEIRAIFQEASLEHHLEGQLITPRYLGQKIGLIRKRRDEREAIHLSSQRGRR